MLKEILINEFLHEAENTRKLLKAIPDSALNWRPTERNWTTAELAAHVIGIYDWYIPVLTLTEFKLETHHYDRGDIRTATGLSTKFEDNVAKAQKALEAFDEAKIQDLWKMTLDGKEIIPATPRLAVVRNVLCNHLYHHRGELVVYLRLTGNKVPGLYGPSADDKK